MANSARLLVLPFFIALSLSCMNVAQGAGTARRLLQATTTTPPIFPNLPPFRGFQFPPYSGPFPEYRLPPFPGISNVPPSAPGFPGSSASGFPGVVLAGGGEKDGMVVGKVGIEGKLGKGGRVGMVGSGGRATGLGIDGCGRVGIVGCGRFGIDGNGGNVGS
ncbi:hypothetical protein Godav_005557 [Gossypium davidsonii]|uniref:Glycine-rich protein n=2 Tax=Gossypium TaxID=3633 RepID=A0A7J8S1T1_GOSDV|nr:hypothetical protein [Gossypium davidsonii]MBA0655124.1 hypothetical protein [Gossypium klotzschianum]